MKKANLKELKAQELENINGGSINWYQVGKDVGETHWYQVGKDIGEGLGSDFRL